MIERVTVVKFRVNCGSGNGAGCFEVKVWVDTAKFTDVIVARLRKCSDLIREDKVSESKRKKRLYVLADRLSQSEFRTQRKTNPKSEMTLVYFMIYAHFSGVAIRYR